MRVRTIICSMCVSLFLSHSYAAGPDYVRDDQPVVDTMDESKGLINSFYEKTFELSLFPELKKQLESMSPFWSDTRLTFKPRSYYFHRDRDLNSAVDLGNSEAWALGGSLEHKSGWWKERLRIATTVYTSQKLYGPDDKDGTLLLKPDQHSFTVLGEAYLELRLTKSIIARVGRTELDMPYLNRQHSRMVPNTFMAYGLTGHLAEPLEFTAGQVTHMKRRDSAKFVPMSKAAGLSGTDEPATVLGMRYNFAETINLGFVNIYAHEFMNTFYTEGNTGWQLTDELALGVSMQFTKQHSVGDELAGDFDTNVVGAKISSTFKGATLSLAFTSTDENSRIRSPFGSYPGYLSLMISDFKRAGEDAWLVGAAYDFSEIGWEGVSGFVNYAEGNNARINGAAAADQSELDLTMDVRFKKTMLDGLWLRMRYARVDQNGPEALDVRDWRVILNYEVPLL